MRSLAVILCAWCAVLAGCGSIGEPLYPALRIPSRVADLTAVERGSRIDIDFTVPPLTTEGLALKEIGSMELLCGPGPASGWNEAEWAAAAKRVDVPTPSKPEAVHAAIPADQFIGKEVIVGVRLSNPSGRFSQWSEFKTVNVETPLATPEELRTVAVPQGVQVTWRESGDVQFRVYRKADQDKKPTLLATVAGQSYVDPTSEYGKTYEYSVQAVHDKVESDTAGPAAITPRDIFPPRVPTGLTASAGVGAVELAWDRNTESDFKEYRVYRSEGGASFSVVAQGLEAPAYSDRVVESGKRYRYQVTAVDQMGNASMPCDAVEVTIP